VSEKTQTNRKVRDNKIEANVKKERVAAAKAEKAAEKRRIKRSIKRRRVDKT
jgi:hypothetical protein